MKICDDHNGQTNLRAKQKYEVLSATPAKEKLKVIYEAFFFHGAQGRMNGVIVFVCRYIRKGIDNDEACFTL